MPLASYAAPNVFGGPIRSLRPCFAEPKILFTVGPPRPQKLVWHAAFSRTYEYGAPRRIGQQTLGLYGLPDLCVLNLSPFRVDQGRRVIMIGTSI